ncbi:hypothetical protein CN356_30995, partial [Bacillus cereus]
MVKKMLPRPWSQYYENIQLYFSKYLQISDLCKQGGLDMDILFENDISTKDVAHNGSIISYPIQRVSRIKREFREQLLNMYWEYRRR